MYHQIQGIKRSINDIYNANLFCSYGATNGMTMAINTIKKIIFEIIVITCADTKIHIELLFSEERTFLLHPSLFHLRNISF